MSDNKIDVEVLVQEVLALPVDQLLLFVSGLPSGLREELHADRRVTHHIYQTLQTMDQDARKMFNEFVVLFRQQIQKPIDQAETIARLEQENAYLREKVLTGVPILDKLQPSL